jgi:MFS family permease
MSHMEQDTLGGVKAWTVCLTAALFFFFIFIEMMCLNVLKGHYKALHINGPLLATMYFYGNVLCLFPAGLLLDRVSTRVVILSAMCIVLLASAVFSFSTTPAAIYVSRTIIGCGGAFCLLAPVRLVSRWFPPQKIALLVGLVVTIGMLGGLAAQYPLLWLLDHMGYQRALQIMLGFGVICWFLIFLVVRDEPRGHALDQHSHAELSNMGFFQSILNVLANRQNWLAGIYASLINLPVFWLGGFYGISYLEQVDFYGKAHQVAAADAALVNGFMFIGLIVGSPLFGWFSDKWGGRKFPMVFGAIASAIVMSIILWSGIHQEVMLSILFFLLGVVISSQVIAYPLVVESNSLSVTGTAEGVASILIMSGGMTVSFAAMLLRWHHAATDGARYSLAAWHFTFGALVVGFLIALLLSFMVRETGCKHLSDV